MALLRPTCIQAFWVLQQVIIKEQTSDSPMVEMPNMVCGDAGHEGRVTGLALLPDWILASVSHDRTIRLWDLHTFKPLKTVKDAHETALQGIHYSPDMDELVTFAMDNFAYVWDAVRLSAKYALVGHSAEITQVWSLHLHMTRRGVPIPLGSDCLRKRGLLCANKTFLWGSCGVPLCRISMTSSQTSEPVLAAVVHQGMMCLVLACGYAATAWAHH